jgi:predicted DNA-binding transcriptional regulator YafY
MDDFPKRARILLLLKYLTEQTDEQHPKKMAEILDHLEQAGAGAERKAVYADIAILRDLGYDVIMTNERTGGYFLGQRSLEVAEAEICAGAISAARFMTEKKSRELIRKLGSPFGSVAATRFHERMELARTQKTRNEEIYYNIDRIVHAQNAGKKISFLYFEYMPDKTQRFKKNGQRYLASPYTLMWYEDCYYLVANIDKYDNLSHFRVDRMSRVEISGEDIRAISEVSEYKNYLDFDEYHRSVFGMFGGKPQTVRIRFKDELATAVFDRFGLDIMVTDIRDGWFTVSVSVRVSPGFLSWLTIFGDKAEVLAPESLRQDVIGLIESLQKLYIGTDE